MTDWRRIERELVEFFEANGIGEFREGGDVVLWAAEAEECRNILNQWAIVPVSTKHGDGDYAVPDLELVNLTQLARRLADLMVKA